MHAQSPEDLQLRPWWHGAKKVISVTAMLRDETAQSFRGTTPTWMEKYLRVSYISSLAVALMRLLLFFFQHKAVPDLEHHYVEWQCRLVIVGHSMIGQSLLSTNTAVFLALVSLCQASLISFDVLWIYDVPGSWKKHKLLYIHYI